MSDITELSLEALTERLTAGDLRAWDVTQAYLDRIRALDGSLHAFRAVAAEQALERAGELDTARRAGQPMGPLHGVPVALKDNMYARTADYRCLAHPRGVRAALQRDRGRTPRSGRRRDYRQDQSR